jgi:hypothetical protein
MNTLAVVASENRKLEGSRRCSLSSRQRIDLRGWLTELRNSEGSVESRNQFSAERRRCHTEETKLKFMCCKIVKRLTVVPPGEYSNKPSVKSRTHKLFVALPPNTQQYYERDLFFYEYYDNYLGDIQFSIYAMNQPFLHDFR